MPHVKAWTYLEDQKTIEHRRRTWFYLTDRTNKQMLDDLLFADELYENGYPSDHGEVFRRLELYSVRKIRYDPSTSQRFQLLLTEFRFCYFFQDKNEPEVLWRLARIRYQKAQFSDRETKKRLIREGYELMSHALDLGEKNFNVQKWTAVLLSEVSVLNGMSEMIKQSLNVKKHLMVSKNRAG